MISAFPIEVDEVKTPLKIFSLTIWRCQPDANQEAGTEFEPAPLAVLFMKINLLYMYPLSIILYPYP